MSKTLVVLLKNKDILLLATVVINMKLTDTFI